MSKYISKSNQKKLHNIFTSYREQYLTPFECHQYAIRDLGLPSDFNIDEYEVLEDSDERTTVSINLKSKIIIT
jgi:hypothetical protein